MGTAGGLVAETGSGVTGIRGGGADRPADDTVGGPVGAVATGARGEATGATGEGARHAVGITGGDEGGAGVTQEARDTGALGRAAGATGSDIIESRGLLLLAGTSGTTRGDVREGDPVKVVGETGVTAGVTG